MNIRKKILFFLLHLIVLFARGLETDKEIIQTQQVNKAGLAVDLIIFSYDRPMQFYAYLESIKKYISGLNQIYVFYRTSHVAYVQAYQAIQQEYPDIVFIDQDVKSKKTFKEQVLDLVFIKSQTPYVMFGVDDIIVTDYIDIKECVTVLKEYNAYGFYLRMGKNITQNYIRYIENDQPLPPLKKIKENIFEWNFAEGSHYWDYPNTLDMTIYKKEDIKNLFYELNFYAPNTLEYRWSCHADKNKVGLCYETSKIVNIPFNQVQHEAKFIRHMNDLSAEQLLEMFVKGMRVDIQPLFKIKNNSAHFPYMLTFIKNHKCSDI